MNVPVLVRGVQCELCGASTTHTRRALVERTVLHVCPSCERFGQLLDVPVQARPSVPAGNVPLALEKRKRTHASQDLFSSKEMTVDLVEDFAQRIKGARERRGWTRQDLGGRIGEREVVVARMENGTLHPPDDVARRIERELGIKLFEPVQSVATPKSSASGRTLGDVLRDAMKKQEP